MQLRGSSDRMEGVREKEDWGHAGPNMMPFFSEWERLQEEPVREGNQDFCLGHEEFEIPVTMSGDCWMEFFQKVVWARSENWAR